MKSRSKSNSKSKSKSKLKPKCLSLVLAEEEEPLALQVYGEIKPLRRSPRLTTPNPIPKPAVNQIPSSSAVRLRKSPRLAKEVPQLSGLSEKKINKISDCLKLVNEITPRKSQRFTGNGNGKIEKSSVKVRSKLISFFGAFS